MLVTPDTDSDDEIPDELKQDVVDEKTGEPQTSRYVRVDLTFFVVDLCDC